MVERECLRGPGMILAAHVAVCLMEGRMEGPSGVLVTHALLRMAHGQTGAAVREIARWVDILIKS